MTIRISLIVLFALSLTGLRTGDPKYPMGYFELPVARTVYLSGTFGELRPSHFHAGLDIKSLNGRPGEKIMASAQGYVARISVSPGGYGNALYIAHPNGYTTVYAHLDRFVPAIAEYVREQQYALKRFRVNLYPRPDQFQLAQVSMSDIWAIAVVLTGHIYTSKSGARLTRYLSIHCTSVSR